MQDQSIRLVARVLGATLSGFGIGFVSGYAATGNSDVMLITGMVGGVLNAGVAAGAELTKFGYYEEPSKNKRTIHKVLECMLPF